MIKQALDLLFVENENGGVDKTQLSSPSLPGSCLPAVSCPPPLLSVPLPWHVSTCASCHIWNHVEWFASEFSPMVLSASVKSFVTRTRRGEKEKK